MLSPYSMPIVRRTGLFAITLPAWSVISGSADRCRIPRRSRTATGSASTDGSRLIADEFAEFAADAGCSPEPVVAELSHDVISFDCTGCADDVPTTFYEIEGAGHTRPGSAVSIAVSEAVGLGVTTTEISASETSWAFFEQHSLAG